ncbi:MAG: family 20 glycosylhydrolase, partial [Planctomycetota bacterium]
MSTPPSTTPCFHAQSPAVNVRGVHLDLKGLAPTFDRLMALLDHFAAMRFNAVLIEWEDMFPWHFDESLRSADCYSDKQVTQIVQRCDALGLSLIPLIQSLGHLENVLKRDTYGHMREVKSRTDCLNPLAEGAGEIIRAMIDDVLGAMPGVRWFHLGGDEAWVFGSHPDTAAYIQKHGAAALYCRHLNPLLDHLADHGIRPILWHDMMMEWDEADLRAIGQKCDLMVWGYRGTPDDRQHHHRRETLDRLAASGVPMWGSSAYKGADGPYRDLPDAEARRVNHVGWADAAQHYGMVGVVSTGWSRYAFSRVQVEPIDACLRELAMVAILFHEGEWPAEGWAACDTLLQRLGEFESTIKLRDQLAVLEETRNEAWQRARQLKEHLAGLMVEPGRGDGGMAAFLFQHFEPWVDRVETLSRELGPMLEPLVGPHSAKAYARTWATALRAEADDLRGRIGR